MSASVNKGRCVVPDCTERVDPRQYPTLCRTHREMAEDQLVDDGLMDPDDLFHNHVYITDDGEYVEAFDG